MVKRALESFVNTDGNDDSQVSSSKNKRIRKTKHSKDIPNAYPVLGSKISGKMKQRRKDLKCVKKTKKLKRKTAYGLNVVGLDSELDNSTFVSSSSEGKKLPPKTQKELHLTSSQLPLEEPSNGQSTESNLKYSYTEHPDLAALPQSTISKFVDENFISIADPVSTLRSFRPITNFSYLPNLNPRQNLHFKSFKSPTPIQAAAWPFLFAGRDVIGVAETGSGKTMAFAVPCVQHIKSLIKQSKGARAVVISPTRELAMQSHEQITKLATEAGLRTVCVYGGVPKEEQRRLLKDADVIVATPGRLNDLINEGSAKMGKVGYVVLDEADRMLDKGFEEEIRKIINTTKPLGERQTLMFTATWPESVRALAATFMRSPVKISIGDNPTGDLRANSRIVQQVEIVDPRGKEFRLLQLLKQYQSGSQSGDRILVFCLYKKEAIRVEGFVRSKGIPVASIHGDLSQEQRTKSLDAFKKGLTPVLVATDVAARGLDIPAVKLVINCTFPLTVEDYVHRIGRTGRAGKDGLAITLFTEHDKAQSGALINILKAAGQAVPDNLLKFGTTVKKKGHDAYGAFFKDVDSTKTATKIRFD